jgi:hypothetical protein
MSGSVDRPSLSSSSMSLAPRFAEDDEKQQEPAYFQESIKQIQLLAEPICKQIVNRSGQVSKLLTCSISFEVMDDPVVTRCGHLFQRSPIEKWLQQQAVCPTCRSSQQVSELVPMYDLSSIIQELQKEEPIVSLSSFGKEDRNLAYRYLAIGAECENQEDALGAYAKAFEYAKSSEEYAIIPSIYHIMGESEKAVLASLYLAQYQLREDKVSEAIETLTYCKAISSEPQTIEPMLLELELSKGMPENVISRIKALHNFPNKNQLFAKAADVAEQLKQVDLANNLRAKISLIIPMTPQMWANPDLTMFPPMPQEMKDFLEGPCPIWPGKKASETHIAFPLFPEINVKPAVEGISSAEPRTLDSLERLDKASGGTGYRYLWGQISENTPADKEFGWAVMTNDVLPGSRNQTYDTQKKLVANLKSYEVPTVLDAATAILYANQHSKKRFFNDTPWTYTRCVENIQGYQLIVGGLTPDGLIVSTGYSDCDPIGVGGLRKF